MLIVYGHSHVFVRFNLLESFEADVQKVSINFKIMVGEVLGIVRNCFQIYRSSSRRTLLCSMSTSANDTSQNLLVNLFVSKWS